MKLRWWQWWRRERYDVAVRGSAVFDATPITVSDTMPTEIPAAALPNNTEGRNGSL